MKTKMMIAAMTALLLMTGCGEQVSGSDAMSEVQDAQSSSSHAEQETLLSSSGADAEEDTEDASTENTIYEWFGIGMNVPAGFTSTDNYTYCVWEGTNPSGDPIYYGYDQFIGYSSIAEGVYSTEDVPDIMEKFLFGMVDGYFPAEESQSSVTVENEIQTTFLGYDVLRHSGTIHAEYFGETHELSYAAYYGVIDLPEDDNQDVPVMWVTFSEAVDDDTRQMLETIVDEAAETAYYLE